MRKSAAMWCSFVALLSLTIHLLPTAAQPAGAPTSPCQTELLSLAPCLGFLTNSSISKVAPACCGALSNVSSTSPMCLCSFLDPGNANQGAAFGINDTRALQLPGFCGLNLDPTECAELAPVGAPAPTPVAGGPVPPSPVASPGINSPANSPTANCAAVTSSLAPCLTYLQNSVSSPSAACCGNLSAVTAEPDCLCNLIQSPPAGINVTAAFNLPILCHVNVLSLSRCAASSPGGEGPVAGTPGNGAGRLLVDTRVSPLLIVLAVLTITIFWNGMGQERFA